MARKPRVKKPRFTLDEWNRIVDTYMTQDTAELFEELCTLTSKIAEIHQILELRNLH